MKSAKSSPPDPAYDAELAQLIQAYRISLQPLAEELAGLIEKLGRKGAREQARRIAHRIHGTAGSYGLVEISQMTGEIQDLLDRKCTGAMLAPYAERLRNLAGAEAL
jgi:HPt (histidine-containing phosphotransfer) domain-containing protein